MKAYGQCPVLFIVFDHMLAIQDLLRVILDMLKVYLRAVNTTVDYKTDTKICDIWFIYIPLHVSICGDHQVAYKYISVTVDWCLCLVQLLYIIRYAFVCI
jgi:hypothetical protein